MSQLPVDVVGAGSTGAIYAGAQVLVYKQPVDSKLAMIGAQSAVSEVVACQITSRVSSSADYYRYANPFVSAGIYCGLDSLSKVDGQPTMRKFLMQAGASYVAGALEPTIRGWMGKPAPIAQ